MKVGVIGPTDITTLAILLGKKKKWVSGTAAQVGAAIAQAGHELWVNSDGGMLAAVASAYKAAGGKKLVLLIPRGANPWPNDHAQAHTRIADEVRELDSWFATNYAVVSEVDICVCVGLSAGTYTELGYVKWDEEFQRGTLKRLLVVRDLVRGHKLPPEFSMKLGPVLRYVAARRLPLALRKATRQESLSLA